MTDYRKRFHAFKSRNSETVFTLIYNQLLERNHSYSKRINLCLTLVTNDYSEGLKKMYSLFIPHFERLFQISKCIPCQNIMTFQDLLLFYKCNSCNTSSTPNSSFHQVHGMTMCEPFSLFRLGAWDRLRFFYFGISIW